MLEQRLLELSAASTSASSEALRGEAAALATGIAGLNRAKRSAADVRVSLRKAADVVSSLSLELRGARLMAATALAPPAATSAVVLEV